MNHHGDELAQLIEQARQLAAQIAAGAAVDLERDRVTFEMAYKLGYAAGLDIGYGQAQHELAQEWATVAAHVRGLATSPTQTQLEHRRWDGPRDQFGKPRPGDHPGGPATWPTDPAPTPEAPRDPWDTLPRTAA